MGRIELAHAGPGPHRRRRTLGSDPGTGARGQSGAALVELALVLPLLTVLCLGVVDMGRAYRLKARLTNAAREGSVYAQYYPSQVDPGATCADPNNVVFAAQHEEGLSNNFTVAVSNATTGGTPIVGCNTTAVAPGTRVTVTVSAPFASMTGVLSSVMGNAKTLVAVSEVVVQG